MLPCALNAPEILLAAAVGFGFALTSTVATPQKLVEAPPWACLAECSAVFRAADQSYGGATAEQTSAAEDARERFLTRAVAVADGAGPADSGGNVVSVMAYPVPLGITGSTGCFQDAPTLTGLPIAVISRASRGLTAPEFQQ